MQNMFGRPLVSVFIHLYSLVAYLTSPSLFRRLRTKCSIRLGENARILKYYTPCFKKTSTHIIGYKLRNSCPILIIFDTKIPDII